MPKRLFRQSRQKKAPVVKIAWSGNNFTVDYKEEIAHPYENDTTRGPINIKATITGSLDPEKRTLSFKASQTVVDKETYSGGQTRRVKTTNQNFQAQNVPADTFTGFGSDMALFTSSRAGFGPKLQVSGKLSEHSVDYDEDGKVRYESTKNASITGPNGSASATFGVSWITPDMPGAPHVEVGTPIKINVK